MRITHPRQLLVALVAAVGAATSLGLLPGLWGKLAAVLAAAIGGGVALPPAPSPPAVPSGTP